MHICVHIGRGSKTMCIIVLRTIFYMHKLITYSTHTHVFINMIVITLHLCSQVIERLVAYLLLINNIRLLGLFSFAKQY